jgi:hypothetical protein
MPKISKTNEDTFRKKLVEEERRKYLEGKGKSKSLQEVEQVALSKVKQPLLRPKFLEWI